MSRRPALVRAFLRGLGAFVLLSVPAFVPMLAQGAPSGDGGLTTATSPAAVAFVPPMMAAALAPPCDGVNYANDNYIDTILMGGPLVGFHFTAAATQSITRLEVFTGEQTAPSFLAVWSDDGGAPSAPLAPLGVTGSFMVSPPNTWYGADLLAPAAVVAGMKYWLVWDPSGGEQLSGTADAGDVQPSYWGSFSGDVNGGASWFGPFTGADHRWKFRAYCGADGDLCPGTITPEPLERLGVNRWALMDADDVFDTTEPNGVGPKVSFTLADTQGCSCEQIIEALHIGEGHEKFGCSTGIMRRWLDRISP